MIDDRTTRKVRDESLLGDPGVEPGVEPVDQPAAAPYTDEDAAAVVDAAAEAAAAAELAESLLADVEADASAAGKAQAVPEESQDELATPAELEAEAERLFAEADRLAEGLGGLEGLEGIEGIEPVEGLDANEIAEALASSEGEATPEEQALAQVEEEADPDGELAPADIEEVEDDGGSLEKLAAKARRLSDDQARNAIHSLLFVSDKPMAVEQLRAATGLEPRRIRESLEALAGTLREGISGVILSEVSGGWQLRTAPESADFVRRFLQIKPRRLTRAALETLAIVAYRQPVTRPEIEEIRGVDCGAVVKALLDWKLLKILGKKDEVGRPLLYGTSREFLEFFQIKDLGSLPTLREFHELNEESRQIVQEELGEEAVAEIPGIVAELADPAFLEAEKERVAKSEAALADLEQAMADAEARSTEVAETLAPPKAADGGTADEPT
ncbi:SMC-Scp complex subunit ScpB [Vulgatibacter incomptus]|uniref:Segregation and condensation protein B n=1 Tax=Vulgatibacter incomptus TaxID=1391653 RepID=A0A0K1PAV0_9BACT|nr:SMC-Scp complex subunit ScpB [Vulgatibacter incomptus]AKU90541.1 Segregation and condensation protein B [Vulgatibacter incomptus]